MLCARLGGKGVVGFRVIGRNWDGVLVIWGIGGDTE